MESIGRYRFLSELGSGGMGTVFEAADPYLDRTIAIKIINLKALGGSERSEQSEFLRERLFREARSAGKLDHPGIVTIFDIGQENGVAYIAMELVDGPSLQQVLDSPPKLRYSVILDILKQTAAALDYAHGMGIIHRDVKPANIMLKKGKEVKVVDFGIAKIVETLHQTQNTVVAGTPGYMSPEQIQGQPVTDAADQFSLAVVAFEMLCGVPPFRGDSLAALVHEIVYGPRPSARTWNADLPRSVDEVMGRALAQRPENRFANCSAFIAALAESMQDRLNAKPTVKEKITTLLKPAKTTVVSPFPEPRRSTGNASTAGGRTGPRIRVFVVGGVILVAIVGTAVYQNLPSPGSSSPEQPPSGETSAIGDPALDGQPSPVTARLGAEPQVIQNGASTTLEWETTGAREVAIDHGIGKVAESGRREVKPGSTTTYKLTAVGPQSKAITRLTIEVTTGPPAAGDSAEQPALNAPEILEFRSDMPTVLSDEYFDLSWNVVGANGIEIEPGVGTSVVAAGRRRVHAPAVSTTYTLVARGKGGESTAQATVIVVDPVKPDPTPPVSSVTEGQPSKDSAKPYPVLGTAMESRYLQKRVTPSWPPEAKSAGVEGVVRLSVIVDANGHVIEAEPISGDSRLQDAARQAVLKYIYRPYKVNGRSVSVSTEVVVAFSNK